MPFQKGKKPPKKGQKMSEETESKADTQADNAYLAASYLDMVNSSQCNLLGDEIAKGEGQCSVQAISACMRGALTGKDKAKKFQNVLNTIPLCKSVSKRSKFAQTSISPQRLETERAKCNEAQSLWDRDPSLQKNRPEISEKGYCRITPASALQKALSKN